MDFDILKSIDLNNKSTFKSFTDRYFSKRYIIDVGGIKNNDIMLMFHSNRITLISLAPSHYFFKTSDKFKLNFIIGNVNRLNNSVKGKGKKGGQMLLPKSVICKVEHNDGTSFDIPCGMRGNLVEINENLVKNPELLREKPDSDGFIAIMLSTIAITDATKDELLTPEAYVQKLSDSK